MANQPHCCRPWTASTERNKGKIDDLIRENRRVKVGKMLKVFGIGQCAVHEMRRRLGPLFSGLAGGGQKTMLSYHKKERRCRLRCWSMRPVPCSAKREEQQMMLLRYWRSRSVVIQCVTTCLEQKIILQDDKTNLRTSCLSVDRIPTNGWLLPHPPYIPTIAPGFLKGWVATSDASDCLHPVEMDFYGKGTLKFLERWQNRVDRDWEFATPVNTAHRFDWHVVFSQTQFYLTMKLTLWRLTTLIGVVPHR
jgi:hypothetical protein